MLRMIGQSRPNSQEVVVVMHCVHVFLDLLLHYCQRTHLIEIKKGHYGDTNLDGLAIVGTSDRPHWLKLYIDESASDGQMDALLELLKLDETLGSIYAGKIPIVSQEKVKISVDRSADNVKSSVPESAIETEMMQGLDGKPIKVENLPFSYTYGLMAYRSITNIHQSNEPANPAIRARMAGLAGSRLQVTPQKNEKHLTFLSYFMSPLPPPSAWMRRGLFACAGAVICVR